jgi:hypothetical protein
VISAHQPAQPADQPEIVVAHAARRATARRGETVTIGRGRGATVRLPADMMISRQAAELQVLHDCVLVVNVSESKSFVLRPPVGEDRVVEPKAATASLPFSTFQLLWEGRHSACYVVNVDATAITPRSSAADDEAAIRPSGTTITSPVAFTPAQRRVLIELCRPLVTESGAAAQPASYQQIGTRLARSPLYIRNLVKAIREELSDHGVAGLVNAESASAEDFRWALARWAVRNRIVTLEDVEEADRDRPR